VKQFHVVNSCTVISHPVTILWTNKKIKKTLTSKHLLRSQVFSQKLYKKSPTICKEPNTPLEQIPKLKSDCLNNNDTISSMVSASGHARHDKFVRKPSLSEFRIFNNGARKPMQRIIAFLAVLKQIESLTTILGTASKHNHAT
jgi:hypothetical protein